MPQTGAPGGRRVAADTACRPFRPTDGPRTATDGPRSVANEMVLAEPARSSTWCVKDTDSVCAPAGALARVESASQARNRPLPQLTTATHRRPPLPPLTATTAPTTPSWVISMGQVASRGAWTADAWTQGRRPVCPCRLPRQALCSAHPVRLARSTSGRTARLTVCCPAAQGSLHRASGSSMGYFRPVRMPHPCLTIAHEQLQSGAGKAHSSSTIAYPQPADDGGWAWMLHDGAGVAWVAWRVAGPECATTRAFQ